MKWEDEQKIELIQRADLFKILIVPTLHNAKNLQLSVRFLTALLQQFDKSFPSPSNP